MQVGEREEIAYIHYCDLASRQWGCEGGAVSLCADCVHGASEGTLLADREGLQAAT